MVIISTIGILKVFRSAKDCSGFNLSSKIIYQMYRFGLAWDCIYVKYGHINKNRDINFKPIQYSILDDYAVISNAKE